MSARELHLRLTVVVPDSTPVRVVIGGLLGRELPGVPGSWIAEIHELETAGRDGVCTDPDSAGDGEDDEDNYGEVLEAEADADAGLAD